VLTISNLKSGYGKNEVLHGANLNIASGERLGLFGPNGNGKTTFLKTISGLLKTIGGAIVYKGMDIANREPREIVKLGLIHVPQGNRLFPLMTVSECLTLGAYPNRAWEHRLDSLEKVFELFPKLKIRIDQRVQTLSGGERQMLSIGAGIMSKPDLLMLDEPSLGLSPKLIEELTIGIKKISDTGITLLLVDQNIEMLLECCGPLYLLEQGVIGSEAVNSDKFSEEWLLNRYFGKAN
jgi:branched-chain amino acid transport system ATP-binding protein